MATLVLTAVGTAIGGPIGAAVAAVIGQQVDARLFAPKARHGPRLGELAVQTSSYGSAIPRIFGTMRVAGTVIWATDLQERRSSSGGGKGRPKTVNYSYSASFAVALSARPIRGVGRIWADGKLLRGAGGDFKTRTGYRLYRGSEDQEVDPLIAAAEGAGQAPAFRGIAYALFEDLQLEDYGNRIPSLSFEVEAAGAAVTIGGIAEELSGGEVADGGTPGLIGYAASGDSIRGAIEALGDVVPLSLADEGGRLRVAVSGGAPLQIGAHETGTSGAGGSGGRTETVRIAATAIPADVSIAFHDPARDFQTGLQRAVRPGPALRGDRRALPAAIGADTAKGLAEYRLAALWTGRASAKIHLAWRRSSIRPGDTVRIEGEAGIWKVARWTLDRMVISLELVRVQEGPLPVAAGADAGRPVAEPDLAHGPTTVRLLDLPLAADGAPDRLRLFVAAAGVEPGWRRADLMVSYGAGASWQAAGPTAAPAVMGVALDVLSLRGSTLIDMASSVEVELLNGEMWLEARSDDALVGGANLALVGEELIQFGAVEPLGDRRFRLSRLLRGRRGTEWAVSGHVPGETFLLIDPESLAEIEPPRALIGGEAHLIASGIGDAGAGVSVSCTISGEAMRPPSPVHLRAQRLPGGDLQLSWVRRSRGGWPWISGSDTPLAEEEERYRIILAGAGFERTATSNEPAYLYTAVEQAQDGLAGPLTVAVVQVGTSGSSRAAQMTVAAT